VPQIDATTVEIVAAALMNHRLDQSLSLHNALDAVLSFGAAMLQAGNTAIRTRERMEALACKMIPDPISIGLTLETIAVSARRSDQWVTAVRNVGPAAINVGRIVELEQFARTAQAGLTAHDVTERLKEIQAFAARYSALEVAGAIGAASSGFAFINGAGVVEIVAAGLAGGIGHWARVQLHHRLPNAFGVAMLSAVAASTAYVLIAMAMMHTGIGQARHPAGFVSAVLFLVPGFPLIAGLFDLLQGQTTAALGRIAHGFMILMAVAFGLSVVIAVAGVDLSRQSPLEIAYPLKLALRGVASVAGGCAFAMLFNSPPRIVLAAGLVALGANELRLALHDAGVMLAVAAFSGTLAVGLMATSAEWCMNVPRVAVTVAPTVIMIPGVYAFEAIVFLQQGKMLDAIEAATSCGFIIGALAMGLAVVRLISIGKS
jgi:uncharacterized membrane protein YjjP (DUF1212 family)